MLKRNLFAALVLAAASSAAFAANTDSSDYSQVVEGKAACTEHVQGTARQTAEIEACDEYRYPHGEY